jgi:protein-tyrosine-phosphatase
MMRDLQWHGVAMVEFRYDRQHDTYWFMEINPRFWGSLPLAIAAGVDFPKALLSLATDQVTDSPRRPSAVKYARNLAADSEWMRARILYRPRLSIQLPSVMRSFFEWLRAFTGREIWDGASWRDPRPIAAEALGVIIREARIIAARLRDRWLHRARRFHNAHVLARADTPRRVVFVCWGNICRSPYAAHRLAQLMPTIDVASAGVHAARGQETPTLVAQVAAARGVDLSGHRAKPMHHLDRDDLIVAFDSASAKELFDRLPARASMLWLAALDPTDRRPNIPDPYGLPVQDVGHILARIDRCCEELASLIAAREPAQQLSVCNRATDDA